MSSNSLPIRELKEKAETQLGKWVTFRTPQGVVQRGILEKVNGERALIRMPYAEAPLHLLMGNGHDAVIQKGKNVKSDFENVAYYAPGGVGYGPGVATPYGCRAWGGGWWWWIWIPLIFLFAFAWCW